MKVRDECERRVIDPSHFAFDTTGRGSLMSALCRLWSSQVVGIEFGAPATDRPVSNGIDIPCNKYYYNFMSEMWHVVRHLIEADQFRGMTEDVMAEGCAREWGHVGGNKIQVEPKDKMKLKTGRSPDLFDSLVCGIEMARRLGFKIETIVNIPGGSRDEKWKSDLRDRAKALWSDHQLSYK